MYFQIGANVPYSRISDAIIALKCDIPHSRKRWIRKRKYKRRLANRQFHASIIIDAYPLVSSGAQCMFWRLLFLTRRYSAKRTLYNTRNANKSSLRCLKSEAMLTNLGALSYAALSGILASSGVTGACNLSVLAKYTTIRCRISWRYGGLDFYLKSTEKSKENYARLSCYRWYNVFRMRHSVSEPAL